jgi:hypothetical protein
VRFNPRPSNLLPGLAERTYRFPVLTRLSGTVRFPDGRPAPGVLLQAQGHLSGAVGYLTYARTGDDGAYAFDVRPGQVYVVTILDRNWAVASRTTAPAEERKSLEGIDLVLLKGTLLHGRITQGPGREPAAGLPIVIREEGASLPKELVTMRQDHAELLRFGTTDSEGRYCFRVGPGHYTLVGQATPGPIALNVKDETEIVRDIALASSRATRTLRGIVIERTPAGDRPVDGAVVGMVTVGRRASSGSCVANDRGEFVIEWIPREMAACARDRRGYLGFVRVGPKDEHVTIVVAPTPEITGRLIDPSGKPYESRRVGFVLKLDPSSDRPVERGGLSVLTDDAGRFKFRSGPVGSEGEVSVYHGGPSRTPVHTSVMFRVSSTDPIELPDLVVPRPGPPQIVR